MQEALARSILFGTTDLTGAWIYTFWDYRRQKRRIYKHGVRKHADTVET